MQADFNKKGFSLLEVIITLSILVMLIYSVAQLMRASFDMRSSLGQEARVTQRINNSLSRISHDLGQAFLVSSKDPGRTQGQRRTVFRIEATGKSHTLTMTYMGHKPTKANAREGDLSYVVYEVKASEKFPGRSHLYRGELPRVPEDVSRYKESPPMRVLAENIESVHFEAWRGDDWLRDKWDSSQGESDNILPPMVRVTIRAWAEDPIEGVEPDAASASVVQFSTIVTLAYSSDFNHIKDPLTSFKY